MQPPIEGSTRKTYAVAFFFLALFAIGWAMLRQSQLAHTGMTMPGDPGPFFLIRLCLWGVGIAGFLLLLVALATRNADRAGPPATGSQIRGARAWLLAAALVASLLAMPWLMNRLGTAEAVGTFSVLWIGILMWLRDGATWRTAATAVGFGVAAAIFVHVIFVRLLTLPLPS